MGNNEYDSDSQILRLPVYTFWKKYTKKYIVELNIQLKRIYFMTYKNKQPKAIIQVRLDQILNINVPQQEDVRFLSLTYFNEKKKKG